MSCAKASEPIGMVFGLQTCVGTRNRMEVSISGGKEHFLGTGADPVPTIVSD